MEANRYGTYLRMSHNEPNKASTTIMETKTSSKSTTAIFKDNILTLFNLLNLLIGVCLLGSWRLFQFILSGNHF